jgi:hypothetical protein
VRAWGAVSSLGCALLALMWFLVLNPASQVQSDKHKLFHVLLHMPRVIVRHLTRTTSAGLEKHRVSVNAAAGEEDNGAAEAAEVRGPTVAVRGIRLTVLFPPGSSPAPRTRCWRPQGRDDGSYATVWEGDVVLLWFAALRRGAMPSVGGGEQCRPPRLGICVAGHIHFTHIEGEDELAVVGWSVCAAGDSPAGRRGVLRLHVSAANQRHPSHQYGIPNHPGSAGPHGARIARVWCSVSLAGQLCVGLCRPGGYSLLAACFPAQACKKTRDGSTLRRCCREALLSAQTSCELVQRPSPAA